MEVVLEGNAGLLEVSWWGEAALESPSNRVASTPIRDLRRGLLSCSQAGGGAVTWHVTTTHLWIAAALLGRSCQITSYPSNGGSLRSLSFKHDVY